jgi:hypothetical protein
MFDQVLDNMRKASEAVLQTQQEFFKKWAGMWSDLPAGQPGSAGQALKFQERWAGAAGELVRMQCQSLEAQLATGVKMMEGAFRLAEAKDFEDLRGKVIELWQTAFDCLRQAYEAQVRGFQTALTRMSELMMKGAA